MKISPFFFILLSFCLAWSKPHVAELSPEQLKFTFISTSGDEFYPCEASKGDQPHQFVATCKQNGRKFFIHLILRESYADQLDETRIEFHFWVEERDQRQPTTKKSNTQSNWITLDKNTTVKKIISYTGIDNDLNQIRLEIKYER